MRAAKLWLFAACSCAVIAAEALCPQKPEPGAVQEKVRRSFAFGERLVYSVKWDPPWYLFFLPTMEAGEADLLLAGEIEYKNKKAWKISFKAHSSGRLAKLSGMKIEDEFVFLTEPETFCTLSASEIIREGKRKRHVDLDYLRDTNQLHIREMDEAVDPPKLKRDEIKGNIPTCVQDPLSALYSFRASELRLGQIQAFTVGYYDRIKEVRTQIEKQESLDTVFGKLAAWNVSTHALLGGIFKEGGQFKLWISADERKLPLQFEAKVSLGRILGRLKSLGN